MLFVDRIWKPFLAVSLGVASLCAQGAEGPGKGGPPPAPVVVAKAEQIAMAPLSWVAGSVTSPDDAQVAAEQEGRLTWVAEEGQRVAAGAEVARLDDSLLKTSVSEAEASVASIEARLTFLRSEVERLKRLAKQNNAAQTQLEQTQSDRDASVNDLAAAQARLEQARERLARAIVRAPFDGVVAERLKRIGEWAGSGDAVVRLVGDQSREVEARASLDLLPFLSKGQPIALSADGTTQEGRLRSFVPVGDSLSRLMLLKVDVKSDWPVGLPVRVALPAAKPRTVLAVPRDALVLRRAGISVFRINAQMTAEKVAVTTGIAQGPLIEVLGGLNAGDQVVIRGGERLRPGQSVSIAPGAR